MFWRTFHGHPFQGTHPPLHFPFVDVPYNSAEASCLCPDKQVNSKPLKYSGQVSTGPITDFDRQVCTGFVIVIHQKLNYSCFRASVRLQIPFNGLPLSPAPADYCFKTVTTSKFNWLLFRLSTERQLQVFKCLCLKGEKQGFCLKSLFQTRITFFLHNTHGISSVNNQI